MYQVRIERRAMKKLAKIPEPHYAHIKAAILALGKHPRPLGYKKLKGRDAYRIRVTDYRIIYEIRDDILLIEVIDLGHRKDIYDR